MAKTSNNKKKNSNKKSVVDKQLQLTPDMNKLIWTTIVVLAIFFVFYFIATIKSDYEAPKKTDDTEETTIQYTEILAGTSFNKSDLDYIVVYYDMSDSENEDTTDIKNAVSSYHSSELLYTCDLSNAFNKKYITTEEANTNPTNAEELAINGPTIIKFSSKQVSEYIQGKDAVVSYLNGE